MVHPGECSRCVWNQCVFCHFWVNCFRDINRLIVLFKSSVSSLVFCLLDLWIMERRLLKSPALFCFFQFCPFLLHVFWSSMARCIFVCITRLLYWAPHPYEMKCTSLSWVILQSLTMLCLIHAATPARSWVKFACLLTFTIFASLNLKCASCRQPVVRFCF